MNVNLENDLQKCLTMISPEWKIQNNSSDKATNFIYKAETLEKCLEMIKSTGVDKNYALHRWYNYHTSVYCEDLFCDYGAVHEKNIYNHDVDIYINNIPYDVKLTVYPAKLNSYRNEFNLRNITGKNKMIKWLYANQSQGARKQILNRIYVMCDGATQHDSLKLKSNFPILKRQISAYMNYTKTHNPNEIEITDNGKSKIIKSELIYVSES
ncbi:MAG: hypothetical protein K2G63_04905 [Oscillospiraceae bacterium]|nr:hypothetical protein [Oscillospiraceae bacterium]